MSSSATPACGSIFAGWDCHGLSGIAKSGMLRNLAASHHLANAVYVGDTQGDCDAAEQAGMDFAFVRYGFGHVPGAAALVCRLRRVWSPTTWM